MSEQTFDILEEIKKPVTVDDVVTKPIEETEDVKQDSEERSDSDDQRQGGRETSTNSEESVVDRQGQVASESTKTSEDGTDAENARVPSWRVREENAARKKAESEVEELRKQLKEYQEKTAAPVEKPVIPSREEDIDGYFEGNFNNVKEEVSSLKERLESYESEKYLQGLHDAFTTAADEGRRAAPDYDNAIQHFVQSRINEHVAFGLTDPEEIGKKMKNELLAITEGAIRAKEPVARQFYKLALFRGYQPQVNNPAAKEEPKEKVRDYGKLQENIKKNVAHKGGSGESTGTSVYEDLSADPLDLIKNNSQYAKFKKNVDKFAKKA